MKKRPELLAPAGNLEKLKMAILYGADAVFIGGQQFGLRSRAGNFGYDEMTEGVAFAHERGAKVYVAANMVTHEGDIDGAGAFFCKLRDIGIDAVIVSDPAMIEVCLTDAPGYRSICRRRHRRRTMRRFVFGERKGWSESSSPEKYRWKRLKK